MHEFSDQIDQGREQRSSSIDQGKTDAQAQREPVQVLPSDFGSNVLNPALVEQDSNFKNDSEDMISRNKKPTNYDLYNMKTTENNELPDYSATSKNTTATATTTTGTFFGDSNVARRTSRSTLDQEGLHRGNISTLPSAGESRRRSIQQHEKEPDPAPTSLLGRTAAAVSTLGAAAAATGLGVSEQLRDKSKQENTAMPSTWPESPKVNNNDMQHSGIEPAIHGQTACYKHHDQVCDTITDSDKHSFCDRVQEPSIHGQNPSFYQAPSTTVNNTASAASVNNTTAAAAQSGAAHQTIAAAVGNATVQQQQRDTVNNNNKENVNNTAAAKPPSPARRLSNSISNLFNGKSSPTTTTTTTATKEKKSLWSAGNSMDTSDKKGILVGAGLGAAGLGGVLSRKNQINDPKTTDAYQLLDNEGTTTTTANTGNKQLMDNEDEESVTESMDELPQTWGDQSTPVVLDEQDPLSRPHAADRAFAEHDIGQHRADQTTPHIRNASAPMDQDTAVGQDTTVGRDTSTHAQIVHNNVDNNAGHHKMGFDKKTGATAGILGGAGIGAAIGSLLGRDKSANKDTDQSAVKTSTTTTAAGIDEDAFGNKEQQAFGGSKAFGTAPVVVTETPIDQTTAASRNVSTAPTAGTVDANEATHAQIVHNDVDNNADHAKMGFDKKTGAAGILGGAGVGAAIGSLVNIGNKKDTSSSGNDATASSTTHTEINNENQVVPPADTTHAQMVHNDVDPNADHAKMGFDKKSSTAAGVLGGAGLGAGVASLLNRGSQKNTSQDGATARAMDDGDQIIATPPPATTHAQIVHNDVDPNLDHAKMGFDKKPTVATRVGNLLKRNSQTEKDIHPFDNTAEDHHKKKTGAGILGGAGIGAAMGSLLHRKKTNEGVDHGEQAFGADASTAVHPTAPIPATTAKGPVIHNALNINNNNNSTFL